MLTSKQRAFLRSMGNTMDSIFQIGKSGITPEVVEALDNALEARELIKVTVLNNCLMDPREIADMIMERTRSDVVQVIGKKIIIFRPSKKKPVIELPR